MDFKPLPKFSWNDPNLKFDDEIPNPTTQIQTVGINAGLPVGVSAEIKLIPSFDPNKKGSIVIQYPVARVSVEDTL